MELSRVNDTPHPLSGFAGRDLAAATHLCMAPWPGLPGGGGRIVKPWLFPWDVLPPRGHLSILLGPPRDAAAPYNTPAAPEKPEGHMPVSGPGAHLRLSGLHRLVGGGRG